MEDDWGYPHGLETSIIWLDDLTNETSMADFPAT
jgi:hypothetical protein